MVQFNIAKTSQGSIDLHHLSFHSENFGLCFKVAEIMCPNANPNFSVPFFTMMCARITCRARSMSYFDATFISHSWKNFFISILYFLASARSGEY